MSTGRVTAVEYGCRLTKGLKLINRAGGRHGVRDKLLTERVSKLFMSQGDVETNE